MMQDEMKGNARQFNSEPPDMKAFFAKSTMEEILENEAEDALVKILEERRSSEATGHNWKPAIPGERPPLARLPHVHTFDEDQDNLEDLTLIVRAMKASGKLTTQPSRSMSSRHLRHDDDLFGDVGRKERDSNTSKVAATHTDTDRLISNAIAVDKFFNTSTEESTSYSSSKLSVSSSLAHTNEELLPLTGNGAGSHTSSKKSDGWFGFRNTRKSSKKKKKARRSRFWCFRGYGGLGEVLNPTALARGFVRFVTTSYFAVIGVPAALLALFLHYVMGNPSLEFLPGDATMAWWLLFLSKQTFMLELSIYIEYCLVDGLALRSKWAVKLLGPLFTLSVIQAKGWPFLTVCWSLLDMVFLHGSGWLFWTDWKVVNDDSGAEIMASKEYFRILFAFLFAGLAHAIKRTTVAMYFGKKTLLNYKAKMEKLVDDIVLVSEIAVLASEINSLSKHKQPQPNMRANLRENKWGSMKFRSVHGNPSLNREVTFENEFGTATFDDQDIMIENDDECSQGEDQNEDLTDDDSDDSDDKKSTDNSSDGDNIPNIPNVDTGPSRCSTPPANIPMVNNQVPSSSVAQTQATVQESTIPTDVDFERTTEGSNTIGARKMLNFLERWIEPVNKLDTQIQDASIGDILKFRKVLTYLDESHPFSESFGSANTRNACIRSSQRLYRRILKATKSSILTFDILALLAMDEDGNEIEEKRRAIHQLFRPDRNNELSLLAFVQSCDTVYKRLRFFRASVGNASVIDKVLEGIIDSLYNFILLLVILSMLQFNPWPLLVSISTLLVSLAFAVGPSTARYIEGVLLIAVRRPYDLGDRILIVSAENGINQGVGLSWFVEDINLFSTTLRFAATNEVSTVNNGAIALSRIVNFARSPRALVTINLKLKLDADDANISAFKAAVETFIVNRPRIWEGINHFRCESIDTDIGLMDYSLRLRSTKTWQDAPGIFNAQGELLKFSIHMGMQLGINFISPNKRLQLYTSSHDNFNLSHIAQDSDEQSQINVGALDGGQDTANDL